MTLIALAMWVVTRIKTKVFDDPLIDTHPVPGQRPDAGARLDPAVGGRDHRRPAARLYRSRPSRKPGSSSVLNRPHAMNLAHLHLLLEPCPDGGLRRRPVPVPGRAAAERREGAAREPRHPVRGGRALYSRLPDRRGRQRNHAGPSRDLRGADGGAPGCGAVRVRVDAADRRPGVARALAVPPLRAGAAAGARRHCLPVGRLVRADGAGGESRRRHPPP